jgi:hypothetical protein
VSNAFSKEEIVAFEDILEGFNDALVLSRNVSIYNTDQTMMERTNNVVWRPQPYISQSFGGSFTLDMTGNFKDYTQLSVPSTIGFNRSVPWIMSAIELRDALQEQRLGEAAKQKLASDINIQIMNVAAAQGTLVVTRTGSATGFDDLAEADAIMNEQGVQMFDRYAALSSRDYNNMASNLQGATAAAVGIAQRSFAGNKTNIAYERAYVGRVANFETYKLDYANRIAAAAGAGDTINTTLAGGNNYVPQATSVAATGEVSNVDNRFQTVTVSNTTGVVAGDCFTIDGVDAVHHITKQSTGQPKTFRVIQVLSATSLVISPPIISGLDGSDASAQYQNVEVTPSATAAINYINTGDSAINPFWQKDALEILPGRFAVPSDAGTAVMRGTTDQGIELVMQKFYDINTMKIKFRLDTLFGVVNKQPEMSGIILFNQP